jgi:hypothetical protein
MNAERIERLAIDRALGELTEDAAVLFDTYLAEHPQAQEWAGRMSEACAQTRRAIDRRTQGQGVENPSVRIRPDRPIRIRWLPLGRWAALVVVSVGIGVTVGRWSRPQVPAPDFSAVQAQPSGSTESWRRVLSNRRQGFWQSKALALLQTKPYPTAGPHDPQANLWEMYKQSRKERSYE